MQGSLAGKAGNETPHGQQAVEEEEDPAIEVEPYKGVEGGLADGEGGVNDEEVGPLNKVVYPRAVLAETAVVVAPELFGCGPKPKKCSPRQDEASPCWTVPQQPPVCCAAPAPHVVPARKITLSQISSNTPTNSPLPRFSNEQQSKEVTKFKT